MVKTIVLKFNDEDFRKLENNKEELKILGKINSWEDFILLKGGLRKKRK